MDVPTTASGEACKLCLKKGSGGRCRLHCGPAAATPKKSAAKKSAKRRPRASPTPSATVKTSPSPRSGVGKKKGRGRTSPETPPSPIRVQMELGSPFKLSPREASPLGSMEREWRLGRESPGMRSLGWSPSKAKEYRTRERIEHIRKWPESTIGREIPFPPEFEAIYDKLMAICESIPNGYCSLHPMTPAVQWENRNEDMSSAKEAWEGEMHKKTNHYAKGYPDTQNEKYPSYDRERCENHSGFGIPKQSEYAYKTLLLPLEGADDIWEKLHCVDCEDRRKISPQLRKKIMSDSIEFLAQEYKIHLQPKPEYQFPVLRILAKLLTTDREFNAHVEAWKAAIPYHRVKTELNLPVIVIYPVWGAKSAQIVLRKIIKAFEKYDAAKIGLNHAPRFNAKYNELIYYAGGAGDQKKDLPDEYFTPGKIFYKGHELKI